MNRGRFARRTVQHIASGQSDTRLDQVVMEEPLEIRLVFPGTAPLSIAVTMRTPGNDFELAAGFLFTEGIIPTPDMIRSITYCRDPQRDRQQQYNIVNVDLHPGVQLDLEPLQRNFYTSSSCGICGKASMEAIRVKGVKPVGEGMTVDPRVIVGLGETLRQEQKVFDKTGGLHAAGWFDSRGNLMALREDVGRHNAVDKLLGFTFLEKKIPLSDSILMVSGRTSFEILQKAAVAGIPVVTAVSAPSSLACETAESFGITLIGFARENRFNIYTGKQRIRDRS